MIVNVWLLYKDGEPRIYTSTEQPTGARLQIYLNGGYSVFKAEVDLPVDSADIPVVKAAAVRVDLPDGERAGQGCQGCGPGPEPQGT